MAVARYREADVGQTGVLIVCVNLGLSPGHSDKAGKLDLAFKRLFIIVPRVLDKLKTQTYFVRAQPPTHAAHAGPIRVVLPMKLHNFGPCGNGPMGIIHSCPH